MLSMDVYHQAVKICLRLREEGYTAFFAGGWVRDWLLGHPSNDIDIATDAPLEKILGMFPRTLLVGMAFGVIIVQLEGHAFEVAIFRRDVSYTNGRKPDRIEPSDPEEDAKRRDFTINGMFYDPLDDKVYDYVGGQADLKNQVIRAIGIPYDRFFEDRLRMVRAIRFSARFGFHIDPSTEEAIRELAPTLFPAVAKERIYQELVKMDEGPHFDRALIDMHRLGLLQEIFPSLKPLHLNDLKKRIPAIPPSLPLVAKLRELLKHQPWKTQEEELASLKLSVKERDLAAFLYQTERNLQEGRFTTPADWARFYAHSLSPIALELEGDKIEHLLRQEELKPHIDRIRAKKPLVGSEELLSIGIPAGKEMGKLLREAEDLAINYNLSDPAEVLAKLKRDHA